MRIATARSIVIFGSLGSIVLIVGVLLLGAAGNLLPLDVRNANGIFKIALPPFFGYLGAACHYIFSPQSRAGRRDVRQLGQLLIGSVVVFYALLIFAITAYHIVNSPTSGPQHNANTFTIEDLETFFAIAMSFLAATTGVIAAYLFAVEQKSASGVPNPKGD